ncbi:MAG: hypothetical protein PHF14_02230 [Verrucomicrobiota bacterium]|jgi:hypothetical protein|nr:hypothetical protein [Verrucomicrobiota bacterium]MDD8045261.1 hypothetical protein [Verrucomicrobiota bacterium]MDD8050211.1 hypothetical protein [Verrucomicrobiota bacterium]MDI9383816.1 hypothetical protein [Verrucomicrobiota bacterium]HCF93461.1 hypothetical protein [Verrucomicrobiota bacterium]
MEEKGPKSMRDELLTALAEDSLGNWAAAHNIVQKLDSMEACWIHAYLHRKEGDVDNSKYWYEQAGKPFSEKPPEEEWLDIKTYIDQRYE